MPVHLATTSATSSSVTFGLLAEELLKGSLADTEVVEIRVKEDKPYIKPVRKMVKLEAIFNQ